MSLVTLCELNLDFGTYWNFEEANSICSKYSALHGKKLFRTAFNVKVLSKVFRVTDSVFLYWKAIVGKQVFVPKYF